MDDRKPKHDKKFEELLNKARDGVSDGVSHLAQFFTYVIAALASRILSYTINSTVSLICTFALIGCLLIANDPKFGGNGDLFTPLNGGFICIILAVSVFVGYADKSRDSGEQLKEKYKSRIMKISYVADDVSYTKEILISEQVGDSHANIFAGILTSAGYDVSFITEHGLDIDDIVLKCIIHG